MCLALPGEVVSVVDGDLRMGRVSFAGVQKEVCLVYVPEAEVGSFVLVHAGFAIATVSEEHARQVLETVRALDEEKA